MLMGKHLQATVTYWILLDHLSWQEGYFKKAFKRRKTEQPQNKDNGTKP